MSSGIWSAARAAIAISLTAGAIGAANAQDRGVAIAGLGRSTCGEFLDVVAGRNEHEEAYYTQWTVGFVTAHNYYTASQVSVGEGGEVVKHFLRRYCSDNPTDKMFMAAAAMIERLGGPASIHSWVGRLAPK